MTGSVYRKISEELTYTDALPLSTHAFRRPSGWGQLVKMKIHVNKVQTLSHPAHVAIMQTAPIGCVVHVPHATLGSNYINDYCVAVVCTRQHILMLLESRQVTILCHGYEVR